MHYQVAGLAHDWPSTHPNPDSDEPTVIDASPIMWRFMQRHSLQSHHAV